MEAPLDGNNLLSLWQFVAPRYNAVLERPKKSHFNVRCFFYRHYAPVKYRDESSSSDVHVN